MSLLDIEPGSLDKAAVHVGDLMIPTSLKVSLLDTEADNQHKTLIIGTIERCGFTPLFTLEEIYGD